MIAGIGVDICSITRMKRAIESEHFTRRVFHPCERDYAFSKAGPARHFASSFAAREAFSKASGISMYSLAFQGAWIERTEFGPVLLINETLRPLLPPGEWKVHLSLSHDGDFSVAMVVLEVLP
ncbi:MAG: holo-ACP synthase [Synergistaceae bacterium]|nr:holo-ACP synthase [Synergistaceae bacterium]